MRTAALSSIAEWIGVASTLLWLSPCAALAEPLSLSWMQPTESPSVVEFRVYAGLSEGNGEVAYAGLPTVDAEGIYRADVQIDEIDQGLPVYVWLTATNDFGESPPSNANFYPDVSFGRPGRPYVVDP
jgi:hypothetical protein